MTRLFLVHCRFPLKRFSFPPKSRKQSEKPEENNVQWMKDGCWNEVPKQMLFLKQRSTMGKKTRFEKKFRKP